MVSIRKATGLIKRHEEVKVIILFRDYKAEEYKIISYYLSDISINASDNVEIKFKDRVTEIPVKQINKVECKLTYVIFYEDLRVILFDFNDYKK